MEASSLTRGEEKRESGIAKEKRKACGGCPELKRKKKKKKKKKKKHPFGWRKTVEHPREEKEKPQRRH